jgi:hypothetical protein
MSGHDHGSGGHAHEHTAGANAKMLGWALVLTRAYLIAEVVGAFVFNSLALLRPLHDPDRECSRGVRGFGSSSSVKAVPS